MTPTEARKIADRTEAVYSAGVGYTAACALRSLADQVEALEGALADIAYSPDMTLKIARAKADRMYKGCAREAT